MIGQSRLLPKFIYRHFIHDSLYRNSIYLLINLAVTAITGFLYVMVIAHFFTQRAVGYSTALVSALGLATTLSNFGINRTIVRFMGTSTNKSQDLITKLLVVSLGSIVIGFGLSLFFKHFGIKQASSLTSVIFILTVFVMSVKGLFDNLFIAVQRASGTLMENSLYSIVRVIFPFAVLSGGFLGIFSAQLAGALIAVTASLLLALRLKFKLITPPSRNSLKGKWRFAFGSYTSDTIGNLPSTILPIIVVAKLGPVSGALWYAAMQIITFLLTISSSINQAMFAEMANHPDNILKIVRKAAYAMYGLVIPVSIIVFIMAHYILVIFSKSYTAAETVLRLMIVFALIGVANYITGSILSLYKKVAYLTVVNIINALVVIIYCLSFAHNLNGIAIGWMLGEITNVVLFVGGALVVMRKNRISVIAST